MTTQTPAPRTIPLKTRLKRFFITGLVILVPVTMTLFILRWIFGYMDGIFAPVVNRTLQLWFPIDHVPGLGLLMTILVVLLLGWLSTRVAGRRIIRAAEAAIARIPVAGTVYSATKGVLEAVSTDSGEAFKRVVLIEYPRKELFAVGFVTGNAQWGGLDERLDDTLLIFIPTTPNPTSGYLFLVPRKDVVPLPISVEEGIRLVISSGVLTPPSLAEPGGGATDASATGSSNDA